MPSRSLLQVSVEFHQKSREKKNNFSFRLRHYHDIWHDLRTNSQYWRRVLVPSRFVHDLGASEAIHSSLHLHVIHERPSPIIFMRAVKNEYERKAMHRAHVVDGAAMCEALSLIERRVSEFPEFQF